jgi:hypothetical protein
LAKGKPKFLTVINIYKSHIDDIWWRRNINKKSSKSERLEMVSDFTNIKQLDIKRYKNKTIIPAYINKCRTVSWMVQNDYFN